MNYIADVDSTCANLCDDRPKVRRNGRAIGMSYTADRDHVSRNPADRTDPTRFSPTRQDIPFKTNRQ